VRQGDNREGSEVSRFSMLRSNRTARYVKFFSRHTDGLFSRNLHGNETVELLSHC